MAVVQFTQQFVANLPTIHRTAVGDFYESLLRTPAADRIKFLCEAIDRQKDFLPPINWSNGKDDGKSHSFRTVGNECFVRLEFVEALVCWATGIVYGRDCFREFKRYYNKAIAFAASEENLSVGYANRSAVYHQLSLFKLCLEDIQLARRYNSFMRDPLKSKLDQRQQSAVTYLLSKVVVEPCPTYTMKLSRPAMQRQPFFINCLTKQSTDIVTEAPIRAGDVISLEKPYSQILSQSHVYERCTYCLTNKKFMSMIPCPHCSRAMFCNQFCYGMAKKIFHRFECFIVDGLFDFLSDAMYLGLRTVFISLDECDGVLEEYGSMLRRCFENGADSFDVNATSGGRSFNEMVFCIIHNLHRSMEFSMRHHLATAVLMERLQSGGLFDHDTGFELVLSTAIFHMIQVSIENSVLLEETAFSGSGRVGNDLTIYGRGLFPFASNLQLSCAPNVILLNNNGQLSGVAIRPIKAGGVIKPGQMSRNHFLSDLEQRIQHMQTYSGQLCHCTACQEDLELFAELPAMGLPHDVNVPETVTDSSRAVASFKMICHYLNRNYRLPYVSWLMGWCVSRMVQLLGQITDTHDTDRIFTQFSKLRRNA